MSNQEQNRRGYKVTVSGQYYAGVGRDKLIKGFKSEVFYVPETVEIENGRKLVLKDLPGGKKIKVSIPNKQVVNGLRAALHVIQRRFLAARLADKYPDYAGFRTCQIIDSQPCVIPSTEFVDPNSKPVEQMTLPELKILCAMESLDTQPGLFASLEDARAAVAQERKTKRNPAPAAPAVEAQLEEEDPDGVLESVGAVSSEDGVPVDGEDEAEDLLS